MKVIVFGCGPAGLMAAQAAADAGATQIEIHSKARKSELFGAQYLHEPIPGFTNSAEFITVDYRLEGSISDYRTKVYGEQYAGSVSPDELESNHMAWDIRDTYDKLWAFWNQYVFDTPLTPNLFNAIVTHHSPEEHVLYVSSVPRPTLCGEGHQFHGQSIWAAGDAPSRGIRLPFNCPPNTVLCNGNDNPSWYRMSNIFDHLTVEWSQESVSRKPPVASAAEVIKPTKHNCDCQPHVLRVGRYGRWEKGVLSHSAYRATYLRVRHELAHGEQPILPGMTP